MMKLITDRTYNDVTRWKELRDKGWNRMTEDERREWLGEIIPTPAASKGMYTHNDLNRVEVAVKEILDRMAKLDYVTPDLVVKTDWQYTDEFLHDDMCRYLSNVKAVRDLLPIDSVTPTIPTSNKRFDYRQANNVEAILEKADTAITNMTNSWWNAGEIYSGEV